MAAIHIPSSYRSVFRTLSELPNAAGPALARALGERPETLSLKRVSEQISAAHPQLSKIAERLVYALMMVLRQGQDYGWTVDQIVQRLVESPDLDLDEAAKPNLGEIASILLASEAIRITAKAADIMMSRSALFNSGKVVTDVRPLFGEDPEQLIANLVIHTMEIAYYDGTDYRRLFVGMDERDLDSLRDALNRAKEKAEVLKGTLKAAGLRYIEVEEE